MARYGCDHCGESFDEDNLVDCARCGDSVCYRCVLHVAVPDGAPAAWWCDRCLRAVGRIDLLRKLAGKPEYHPPGEVLLVIEAMKRMTLLSKPGSIRWPKEELERAVLMHWLELLGFDVGDVTDDFLVPPRKVSFSSDELRLSPEAYRRLEETVLASPGWADFVRGIRSA